MNNYSNPIINNCLIYNNWTNIGIGGGIVVNNHSCPIITNCSIISNTNIEKTNGIGIMAWNDSNVVIINTILWDNITEFFLDPDPPYSTIDITYSDIEGGYTGTGNI